MSLTKDRAWGNTRALREVSVYKDKFFTRNLQRQIINFFFEKEKLGFKPFTLSFRLIPYTENSIVTIFCNI